MPFVDRLDTTIHGTPVTLTVKHLGNNSWEVTNERHGYKIVGRFTGDPTPRRAGYAWKRTLASAPPQSVVELREVADMARETARAVERTEQHARDAANRTTPGTPSHRIALSALHGVTAAHRPAEQAWHAAAAAFIALSRTARAARATFPVDDAEQEWADVPEVAALLAAHEAN
jgi:hypothetical protein